MIEISVIIPCYNEEKTIGILLNAVLNQTTDLSNVEVVIADGMSTDSTRSVISGFQNQHSGLLVRVVDNPQKNIPAGLNAAIRASTGEYLVRLDAHCIPDSSYITLCVSGLKAELADNVGGIWEIVPGADSWIARGISAAASHPLGAGDAKYRISSKAQYVSTVPFGSFHRRIFDRIGFFNEQLLTNEDYEFNTRIRKSGGKIWLNPEIRSKYIARKNIHQLAKQYLRYGFWKARMIRMYPDTLRWRQLLPPLFVAVISGLFILSIFSTRFLFLLIGVVLIYLLVMLTAGTLKAIKTREWGLLPGLPLSIATMHLCWGGGFIWSFLLSFLSPAADEGTTRLE
jgi:glycosyltransferase involved in cell wall biosynthesis